MRDFVAGVLAVALYAAAMAVLVFAGAQPAHSHEPYSKWLSPFGGKCCEDPDRECRRVAARYNEGEGRFEIWHGGEWAPVPHFSVLGIPSPDGNSHACISFDGKRIFCFVNGGALSHAPPTEIGGG